MGGKEENESHQNVFILSLLEARNWDFSTGQATYLRVFWPGFWEKYKKWTKLKSGQKVAEKGKAHVSGRE